MRRPIWIVLTIMMVSGCVETPVSGEGNVSDANATEKNASVEKYTPPSPSNVPGELRPPAPPRLD